MYVRTFEPVMGRFKKKMNRIQKPRFAWNLNRIRRRAIHFAHESDSESDSMHVRFNLMRFTVMRFIFQFFILHCTTEVNELPTLSIWISENHWRKSQKYSTGKLVREITEISVNFHWFSVNFSENSLEFQWFFHWFSCAAILTFFPVIFTDSDWERAYFIKLHWNNAH